MSIQEIINNEIANDPLGRGYASMTVEEALASLLTEDRNVADTTQYTAREYYRRFGPDADMLAAIKAVDPVAHAMLTDFGGDGGLDFSSATTIATIQALESSEVITAEQSANCQALGVKTVSRVVELEASGCRLIHVIRAMRSAGYVE